MLHTDFDRCGTNLIRREHARCNTGGFGKNHRQITFLALVGTLAGAQPLYIAKNTFPRKTQGRRH